MSDKLYTAYGGDKIIDLENEQIAEAFGGGGGNEFVINKTNYTYDKTPSEVLEAIKADKTIYIKEGSWYRYIVLHARVIKDYETELDQPYLAYINYASTSSISINFLMGNTQTGTWSTQTGYTIGVYPPS